MHVDKTRGMGTFVSDAPGGPYKIADKNPLLMSYTSCAYTPKNPRRDACDAPTYFARFWLRYDAPDPSSPPELLVVHQSYSQTEQMARTSPPPPHTYTPPPPPRPLPSAPRAQSLSTLLRFTCVRVLRCTWRR